MSGLAPKKQAQGQEIKRFSGVCGFKVVAINPTKAELEALGVPVKEEPNYKGDKDGVATLRVDFWLRNVKMQYLDGDTLVEDPQPFTTKASYWVENSIKRAKSGKCLVVNDYVQSSWAESVQALKDNPNMTKWFQTEGIREAYVGEVELLEMLFKWSGYSSHSDKEKGIVADKLKLSKNIAQIITSGDVSELKDAVKGYADNDNGIKFLIGVLDKEGKLYQTVYTHFPMSPGLRNYDKLNEAVSGEFNQFKADYQNSFELKLYKVKPGVQSDAAASKAQTPELKF